MLATKDVQREIAVVTVVGMKETVCLPKMLSGANAFEISDIERMNIKGASAGGLGRNNVTCLVVTRNNNSPGTCPVARTPVKCASKYPRDGIDSSSGTH